MHTTRTFSIFSLSFLLTLSSAFAEVREVKSMKEILPFIHENTVVVFDLDNTVIEATQSLGSDQFFEYLMRNAKKLGMDDEKALAWSLERAALVQPITPVEPVEPLTPTLIRALQKKGVPTVALTSRPLDWANETLQQLRSVGVSFTHSRLYRGDAVFGPDSRGRNLRGVLFMPRGGDKGTYLNSFIRASKINSNEIIFIDDKTRNVESVEQAFKGTVYFNLNFRYGAADPKVKNFNDEIAHFQWTTFIKSGEFISDREAERILKDETKNQTEEH